MTDMPPINLEHYPIHRRDCAAYADLIARAKQDMAATGACMLDNFVNRVQLAEMVSELEPYLEHAFFKTKTHNAWLIEDDPSVPPDHARNAKQTTTSATLGYDFIPKGSALDALYTWPPFKQFIADVLGFETLYPYEDALAPVNVLVYKTGTETGWHFDGAKFTITLLLQEPEAGAAFQYAPFIRDGADDGYSQASAVMNGSSGELISVNQPAGCLVLFKGAKTLHRVTPVEGERSRLVAVLSYSEQPGTKLNATTQKTFYGRVA